MPQCQMLHPFKGCQIENTSVRIITIVVLGAFDPVCRFLLSCSSVAIPTKLPALNIQIVAKKGRSVSFKVIAIDHGALSAWLRPCRWRLRFPRT